MLVGCLPMFDQLNMSVHRRHRFWPPIHKQLEQPCPLVHRMLSALLVLCYQNTDVERDLSLLRLVKERGSGQLSSDRLDQRARV